MCDICSLVFSCLTPLRSWNPTISGSQETVFTCLTSSSLLKNTRSSFSLHLLAHLADVLRSCRKTRRFAICSVPRSENARVVAVPSETQASTSRDFLGVLRKDYALFLTLTAGSSFSTTISCLLAPPLILTHKGSPSFSFAP